MAYKYYLMNGKNGKGKALNILVDGKIHRDFKDISTLDLQTMEIRKENASSILSEYNPKGSIDGLFYDASFPHKKTETKTYAPIFDITSDKTKKYLDSLKYFAEQRDYKIKNGLKLKLDENDKFDEFIKELSYYILKTYNSRLVDYESLIASNLKNLYKERFTNYSHHGTEQYMLYRLNLIRSYLSNYTQLRNLTLEFITNLEENRIVRRSMINRTAHWDNEGMEEIMPYNYKDGIKDDVIYEQMTLDQFMDMRPKKH